MTTPRAFAATAASALLVLVMSGCGIPLTSKDLSPTRPTETIGGPTSSASSSASATVGTVQDDVECVAVDDLMLKAVNNVGSVGGYAHFASGQMVKASDNWWLVAVVSEIYSPGDRTLQGIDPEGVMAFATNAPSGGRNWVPLSGAAKWDGVTPTGEKVPGWRDYRELVVACARQA